jgi:hypothetical protein
MSNQSRKPIGKLNLAGLSKSDYKGMPTTLCQGCGHNSISSQIIAACYGIDYQVQRYRMLEQEPGLFLGTFLWI